MGVFKIGMIVQLFTLILHLFWLWILIYYFGLGLVGGGIAMSITFVSSIMLMLFYVHYVKHEDIYPESLHWFNWDSLKDWGIYLKLGIPSAAMLCFEWFAFEIIAIFAGFSGVFDLAAYIAMFNFL